MSTALIPGAPPKSTPKAKEPKRLTGKPHRIPGEIRLATFMHYGYVCQWCETPGGALDLHHKLRRSQGGRDTVANLVPVHRTCHRRIHEAPAEARQRGFLIGTGTKT